MMSRDNKKPLMIRLTLTDSNGTYAWVNANKIIYYHGDHERERYTRIVLGVFDDQEHYLLVQENANDIQKIIDALYVYKRPSTDNKGIPT